MAIAGGHGSVQTFWSALELLYRMSRWVATPSPDGANPRRQYVLSEHVQPVLELALQACVARKHITNGQARGIGIEPGGKPPTGDALRFLITFAPVLPSAMAWLLAAPIGNWEPENVSLLLEHSCVTEHFVWHYLFMPGVPQTLLDMVIGNPRYAQVRTGRSASPAPVRRPWQAMLSPAGCTPTGNVERADTASNTACDAT